MKIELDFSDEVINEVLKECFPIQYHMDGKESLEELKEDLKSLIQQGLDDPIDRIGLAGLFMRSLVMQNFCKMGKFSTETMEQLEDHKMELDFDPSFIQSEIMNSFMPIDSTEGMMEAQKCSKQTVDFIQSMTSEEGKRKLVSFLARSLAWNMFKE